MFSQALKPQDNPTYENTYTCANTITPAPNNPRALDVFGFRNYDTRSEEIKKKYKEMVEDEGRGCICNPIDPTYVRVDNILPATKLKMKEYDEYNRY